ncbi:hypothetical protein BDN72DRAFT_755376 [Pluteus cervinus]|uniref:Uncharacterized protein n=1 Tax=Pluteus cervinus TaxID=181527 RepID=A0ACD3BFY7_9AGAR|nr:hypothetical protein BDN72DRAFT_755376 [Pluteus cervinus]
MVAIKTFFAALALSGVASALPRPKPDSAIGEEVAVSAPFGVLLSDTAELASQTAAEAAATQASQGAPPVEVASAPEMTQAPSYGGMSSDSYGSSYNQPQQYQPPPPPPPSYTPPSYGSGKSSWSSGSNYDDCVNQCIASFGNPPAQYMPTATSGYGGDSGGKSNGATHTVIVAPTQGVLRYIPFAVNASVGDTIKFMWGANNHTVTKGSALLPCNKTAEGPFASGIQLKDFVFTQVVNDTNPTYYYCAFPNHCQKGMFGIINPPSSAVAPTSVGSMMSSFIANNSDISAYASYTKDKTANNDQAARWGTNIDMGAMPEWSHQYVAENVLYTRNFLASNNEVLQGDGSIDLSSAGSTPLMIPQDISAALNNAAAPSASSASASSSSSSAAPSQTSKNGASSMTASRVLVGAAVAFVTFFAL